MDVLIGPRCTYLFVGILHSNDTVRRVFPDPLAAACVCRSPSVTPSAPALRWRTAGAEAWGTSQVGALAETNLLSPARPTPFPLCCQSLQPHTGASPTITRATHRSLQPCNRSRRRLALASTLSAPRCTSLGVLPSQPWCGLAHSASGAAWVLHQWRCPACPASWPGARWWHAGGGAGAGTCLVY